MQSEAQAVQSFTPLILTVVAALITGIPPTLAALAAYKQSMAALKTTEQTQLIARKIAEDAQLMASKLQQEAHEQALKTGTLIGKVDEVHTLTNSNLAQVRAELATAAARIESLIGVVSELKSERGKAQMREALYTPAPSGAERRTDDPTLKQQLDVQKEIAANTEETAANTTPVRNKPI